MILLDTNVLSELMRPDPHTGVVAWVDQWPVDELAVTTITVSEVLFGLERLEEGLRRRRLESVARTMFEEEFRGRILPFDLRAAEAYATLAAHRMAEGHPISMADAQIAAIARTRNAALATRNIRDFSGLSLELFDPWEAGR
ncbi:MAG: type II toxin-antitoxin system VapC family toxin [Thiohalospira sp.]